MKSLHKFTSENLKNKWLEEVCLDGVHFLTFTGFSGLVWTLWMSEMNPSIRYPSSSHMFYKFSDVDLRSDFDSFWENLTCNQNFMSEVHLWHPQSYLSVDVRNEPPQGTCPQAICSPNFLVWILKVISIPFEKTWPALKQNCR